MGVTLDNIIEQFKNGFDCSQIVVSHFAERLGIDDKLAKKMAAAFGGGMFAGETCGGITGAYIVIGLVYGHCTPNDMESKGNVVSKVMEYNQRYKEFTDSNICRDMLGYDLTKPDEMKIIEEKGLFFSYCPKAVKKSIDILEDILDL